MRITKAQKEAKKLQGFVAKPEWQYCSTCDHINRGEIYWKPVCGKGGFRVNARSTCKDYRRKGEDVG